MWSGRRYVAAESDDFAPRHFSDTVDCSVAGLPGVDRFLPTLLCHLDAAVRLTRLACRRRRGANDAIRAENPSGGNRRKARALARNGAALAFVREVRNPASDLVDGIRLQT